MAELKRTIIDGAVDVEGNANVQGELIETGFYEGGEDVQTQQGFAVAEVLVIRTSPDTTNAIQVPNDYTAVFVNRNSVGSGDVTGDAVFLEDARWLHGVPIATGTLADNYVLRYNGATNRIEYTDLNAVIAAMPEVTLPNLNEFNTDDLVEGDTNQYYTDARARGAISATGDLTYDPATGVFNVDTYDSSDFWIDFSGQTTDGLNEGSINQYFTYARAADVFDQELANVTTDNIAEGGNLYYTDARVYSALSSGGDIAYNGTGRFSVTTYKTADFETDFASQTTDDLAEGSTNLYFTPQRALDAVGGTIDNLTTVDIPENPNVPANANDITAAFGAYFTPGRVHAVLSAAGDLAYNGTGQFSVTTYKTANFTDDFATMDTGDLAEGTNLYFTNQRAIDAVAGSDTYLGNTGDTATGTYTFTNTVNVGNLRLTGNTLSSTNVDGNINIYPNGAGIISVDTNIIPTVDNTYSLGSADFTFRDVYIGPGSLYVNGKQVISDESTTMRFTTDPEQNLTVATSGAGILRFSSGSGDIALNATAGGRALVNMPLVIGAGHQILSSDGNPIIFGEDIAFDTGNGIDAQYIRGTLPEDQMPEYARVWGTRSDLFAIGFDETDLNYVQIKNANGELQIRNSADNNDADLRVRNLTVNGTVTQINSEQVAVADNIIELNSNTTGTPTQDAGITVNRGDLTNASLIWDESDGVWKAGLFAAEQRVAVWGDNVSNFANDAGYLVPNDNVSALTNDANYVSNGDNVSLLTNDANYLSQGDAISLLANDANYLSAGDNVSSLNNDAGYISGIGNYDTGDLTEGTNLYFTNERVDDRVAALLVGGTNVGVVYDDVAGTLTINSTFTDTTYTAGTGLTLTGTTFAHADTSGATTTNTDGATIIDAINVDGFGHVTGIGTRALTPGAIGAAAEGHGHGWAEIIDIPVTATRWPAWAEVTDKPLTFAPSAHNHDWADITGEPAEYPPEAHQHAWGDITGAPATATRWPAWGEVTAKPTEFTPTYHEHDWNEINNIPASVTGTYVPASGGTFTGDVTIQGALSAASKSFVIPHPTKEEYELHHGSLEGPEFGIYFRGELYGNNIIELPDYWSELADEYSITVQLTPKDRFARLYVESVSATEIVVKDQDDETSTNIQCYYIVHAERKDIEKMTVEQMK